MTTSLRFMIAAAAAAIIVILPSCTGRRADNMKPLGETVEVVVPAADVARDSAVAAGNAMGDSVAEEQPGIAVL
ncbi:MAG: hypothetical protein K2O78_05675 [Muribaculaceae bacterium]|nr:hypothetical protein [Muribaculaceae bacterium]MDE7081121.1 hypothetical protein [Muribaculaceae bacterium]